MSAYNEKRDLVDQFIVGTDSLNSVSLPTLSQQQTLTAKRHSPSPRVMLIDVWIDTYV